MSILKQNSVIMNIQYKMSLHWGKCHCLGTSSDLSNIRFITLHLRWRSSVMLSQMYQHLCSPCIPIQMRTMFTTSSLANLPLCLFHFGKSFSFCVFLSTHLWYLGDLSSGFAVKFGSMGEAKSHSSAQVLGSFSWCSSLETRAGSPTTSPSFITTGTHLLWRGEFACLDRCRPWPLAPGCGSAPGAMGTHLPTPTSTAHPKHCFVCHQTPPLYGCPRSLVTQPASWRASTINQWKKLSSSMWKCWAQVGTKEN